MSLSLSFSSHHNHSSYLLNLLSLISLFSPTDFRASYQTVSYRRPAPPSDLDRLCSHKEDDSPVIWSIRDTASQATPPLRPLRRTPLLSPCNTTPSGQSPPYALQ